MNKPYVEKVLAGKVKKLGKEGAKNPLERPWKTGMFKYEVEGAIWVSKTGLTGDEVADTKNHGGIEKALFAYPKEHYEYWKKDLQNEEIDVGAMGENFSVVNMDEFNVCIGDTYKLGETVIQVSQPRRPCWKPARRHKVLDFALRIQNSGKTGWYFRVLEEGSVEGNKQFELRERPFPEWTIATCNELMYEDKDHLERIAKLASCELLAENWRTSFQKRLQGHESTGEKRIYGPNIEK